MSSSRREKFFQKEAAMRNDRITKPMTLEQRREMHSLDNRDIAAPFARELEPRQDYPRAVPMPAEHSNEMGNHALGVPLPGGNSLNVVTNHNTHLTRKEWIVRGVLGALGRAAAWPFKLVGDLISQLLGGIIAAVLGILKLALIIIAVPTLLWLGFMLLEQLQGAESIDEGAGIVVDNAGSVANGVGNAITK